jgi:hypothetical protein
VESTSRAPTAACGVLAAVGATLGCKSASTSLTDWLFPGGFSRFPERNLAVCEGQAGWIPYVLERADPVPELQAVRLVANMWIPVQPSTQYDGRTFGCGTADASLAVVGEEDICFGTDCRHTDTTWPYSETSIEKLCAGVAPRTRRGSAIRVLELDRV